MTGEECYNLLVEYFGDTLPDPISEPIRFRYYVMLYLYYKER
jgi:hypothetical protein